jgi:nucleoside-diphosphate-sugar epimerase
MIAPSHPIPLSFRSTVVVLGARGRLGLALCSAFARAGWRVLAQVRPGKPIPADVPPGVQWLAVPLTDSAALVQAATGAQVVVNALSPTAYTNRAWKAEVPEFMLAAQQLATALQATLMLPGNVYAYGRRMPPLLDESTPFVADTVKGRLRESAEAQMSASAHQGGPRGIVIRAGDFFGGGSGTWLDLVMATRLRKGQLSLPGPVDLPHAWAYLPDLAQTFVRVAERREALPPFATLHFQGHTLSGRDWLAALQPIAQAQGWVAAGRSLKPKTVPWPLLRWMGLFSPTLASVCEMRYLWFTPHALDNQRLTALIGEEPHTPTEQAVNQALQGLGFFRERQGAPAVGSSTAARQTGGAVREPT